mgnify:CR=1 FL=1
MRILAVVLMQKYVHNLVHLSMKYLLVNICIFLSFLSFSQKETSMKLSLFVSPVVYQFENSDDWINTINSNYVIFNRYNTISNEIGLSFTYQINKLKFGGGLSLKNYIMKFDIGFSSDDVTNRNIAPFFTKPRELKSNSLGIQGIVCYKLTKTTDVNFILNFYRPFYIRNNTVSGYSGEIAFTDAAGFDILYKEYSSNFRRPNLIPEININTSLTNGFYLNYGIKSKIRARTYFSASIEGKTSSSSPKEILLDMDAKTRHTAVYVGIGYSFGLKTPKNKLNSINK